MQAVECGPAGAQSAGQKAAVVAILAGAGAVLVMLGAWLGMRLWLSVLACVLFAALLKWPEICLLLFLTAGTFKLELATLLQSEVDITLVLAVVLGLGLGLRLLRPPPSPTTPHSAVLHPYSSPLLPFLGLALLVLVSALVHPDTTYGSAKAVRFVSLTGLALAAAYLVLKDQARLTRFFAGSAVMGAVMVVMGRVTSAGLTAFNATHIATGRIIGLGLLGSIFLIMRSSSRLARVVLIPLIALLSFGFLYSGSRGSLVALVASMVAVAAAAFRFRRGRGLVAGAAVILGLALAAVTFLFPAAAETMNSRVVAVFEDAGSVGSAAGRLHRAEDALELIRDHPLFGVGIGGFDLARGYGDSPRGDYAHNILLEVGCELGLLGLALLIVLILPALSRSTRALAQVRTRHGFATAAVLLAVLVYFLVNAMFSGDLNDNRLLFAGIGMC
ncbi:MAG: O-antigen ligase family protein, partial [candidate division WOR-3 bacterium]